MADALCGPSNPLQQFRKTTQLDRTLQQDRLTARRSPAQGFRSPDPNAGILDPEFEAFQAGLSAPGGPAFQPFQPHGGGYAGQAVQAPDWATDFQQMHITSPPILEQHRLMKTGPCVPEWAQGFQTYVAQAAPRAQISSPSPLAFQNRARYGMSNFMGAAPAVQPMSTDQISKGKRAVFEQFDEAAFEAAFDQARAEMADPTAVLAQKKVDMVEEEANINFAHRPEEGLKLSAEMQAKTAESTLEYEAFTNGLDGSRKETETQYANQVWHEIREGFERVEQQRNQADKQRNQENDELAATAQELLEKVEDNQSDKFRNSQFLGLMRKLRDREVQVEGDKMIETVSRAAEVLEDVVAERKDDVWVTQRSVWEDAHVRSSLMDHGSTVEGRITGLGQINAGTISHDMQPTITSQPNKFAGTWHHAEQKPAPIDARPFDAITTAIPPIEQDYDHGRDGQAVVNLLNERSGSLEMDMGVLNNLSSNV